MIRIVVVDDEPLVRAGITMLVAKEEDITIVAEAADGDQALSQVRVERPDVVLMDVRMPGTDGVAATRAVVEEGLTAENGGRIGVIVLTSYQADEVVFNALRAGAAGFILKDAAPEEIVAAIRVVASGEAWLDPAVTRLLIDDFNARPELYRPTQTQMAQMAQLTQREREVLVLLSHGLSNDQVAKRLFISVATVKTHLAHLMRKLGVREKAQAIIAAYQTGLVDPGPGN